MALPPFSVTWDYRCPFARNAHEHVVAALQAGAPWDVTFLPFSLSQAHLPEGATPVWDDPVKAKDLMAMAAAVVVRDRHPDHFLAVHLALFSARHEEGLDLRDPEVVQHVVESAGAPGQSVMAEVGVGWAQKEMRNAHQQAVADHDVFGVPTFIVGDQAVFVRLMNRPNGDADLGRTTVERTVELIVGQPEINEFKHTSIAR